MYSRQDDEFYNYDANGNRTNSHIHGTSYVIGTGNQLKSDGVFTYTYDGEGSLKTKTEIATGKITEYGYDHHNRLVSVVQRSSGGIIVSEVVYTYDTSGRRIEQNAGGTHTLHAYNGDEMWASYDPVGNPLEHFLTSNRLDDLLAFAHPTSSLRWPLSDLQSTTRDELVASLGVQHHFDFTAFGLPINTADNVNGNVRRFGGRIYEESTALYDLRSRNYSPSMGRFVSTDLIGFSSNTNNLYAYVGNSPTNAIDPLGTSLLENRLISRISASLLPIAGRITTSPLGLRLFALLQSSAAFLNKLNTRYFGVFNRVLVQPKEFGGAFYRAHQSFLQGGRVAAEVFAKSLAGRPVPYDQITEAGEYLIRLRLDSRAATGQAAVEILEKGGQLLEVIRFRPL